MADRTTWLTTVAIALVAALVGSLLGTVALIGDEMGGHMLRHLLYGTRLSVPPGRSEWVAVVPLVMISMFGTLPGALLVGVPATYPFREIVARQPFVTALPMLIYAILLSQLLFGWLLTPYPDGTKEVEILWFYSSATALGFVIGLGWWGRHAGERISAVARDLE